MSNLTFFKNIFNSKLNRILILFIFLVFLLTILSGIFSIPYEDAAITYQYSKNLAETGVISYIPGGERAEGVSDFSWMIIIAFLYAIKNEFSFVIGFFEYDTFLIGICVVKGQTDNSLL